MINYIKYRSKLSALTKAQSKLNSDFEKRINKAKRENKPEDFIKAIKSEHHFLQLESEDNIKVLSSIYYLKEAKKRNLTIPDFSSNLWEKVAYRKVLTADGIDSLKSDIQTYKKELILTRYPYFIVAIGVTAALIGLFTVIL